MPTTYIKASRVALGQAVYDEMFLWIQPAVAVGALPMRKGRVSCRPNAITFQEDVDELFKGSLDFLQSVPMEVMPGDHALHLLGSPTGIAMFGPLFCKT